MNISLVFTNTVLRMDGAFRQRGGTFKMVLGTLMEDSRNFCSEDINEYCSNLEHTLSTPKISSAFVVNIDEA